MGFLRNLFRGKEKHDEETDIFDQMMGVSAKAKVSSVGYPVCPACGWRFPVLADVMRKQSSGRPIFECRGCGKRLRL